MESCLLRPVIWRSAKITINCILVPYDSRKRILMLVWKAECMTDFMNRDINAAWIPCQVPPEVHCTLLLARYIDNVASDIRPSAITAQKADADFSIGNLTCLLKFYTNADIRPYIEALAHQVPLHLWTAPRAAAKEMVSKLGAVHPLLLDVTYEAGAVGGYVWSECSLWDFRQ